MKLYIKLNIQRFGTTVSGSVSETSVDTNANTSKVYATFTQVADSNTWNTSGSAYYNISCGGKSTGNVSYTFGKGSTKTFSATLGPYEHNADGSLASKTVTFVVHGDVSNSNHTFEKTVSFTTIPRYFSSCPTMSVASKTATSVTINWTTPQNCSWTQYKINDGSWVNVETDINKRSGTITVTGLTPNTTYTIHGDFMRKDSEQWATHGGYDPKVSVTTYKKPTITVSVTGNTETSITFKATPSIAIKSKSWTLKNSGGTTVATSTDTAESHTFTGLSVNTNYTLYVYCVSTDALGAVTSDTYQKSYSTSPYPTITKVGTTDLTIGNSQTLTINNPKSRTVTVYMKKTNTSGTTLYSGTTSGTSITFTPTASTLYNSIPNAHNATCVYYLTYSSYTSGTKSGTYKIKETEAPTFSTSNWSYNVNNTYNALTGNDTSVVIKGYSTVNFSVNSAATSSYGASFTGSASGYVYNWGDGAVSLTKTTTASIAAKNSNVLKITAYDDRSLSTISSRTLTNGTNYVDYSIPTFKTVSTHRANGIDAATTLTLTGKLGYVGKFGTNGVTNTVASIKYKTKPANSSTWSSEYNLTGFTVNTSTGDFSLTDAQIHANGSSGGFTVGTKYNVMVIVRDAQGLLGSASYTVDVTDGKIARDVYQDSNGEYHEGINGRADSSYTQKIHGALNVTGNEAVGGNLTVSGTAKVNNNEVIDRSMVTNNTSKTYISAGTNIPNRNTIAYWNGAYGSSNASNLTYCNKGAFGDACVKGVATSPASGGTGLITSGGVYSAINGKLIDSSGTGYIRFTDGTQICYGSVQLSKAFNVAWASFWETAAVTNFVTFAKAFSATPYITMNSSAGYTAYPERIERSTTKITSCVFWRPEKSTSAISFTMDYIAIGKWK